MNHLDNIDKPYIPAAKTNIVETLKKLGWTPPSEDKRFIETYGGSKGKYHGIQA